MEECIGGLDIWGYHGRRVSFKALGILEYASHAEDRFSFVIWYHQGESRQVHIVNILLKVENDRMYVIRDFLVSRRTARGREAPLEMGVDSDSVGAA